jgi:integrase
LRRQLQDYWFRDGRACRRRAQGDLSESERGQKFSGHSLRAGLASSAEVDEPYVQKHLGHASAEMTPKYQRRRDRLRVIPTKASGL